MKSYFKYILSAVVGSVATFAFVILTLSTNMSVHIKDLQSSITQLKEESKAKSDKIKNIAVKIEELVIANNNAVKAKDDVIIALEEQVAKLRTYIAETTIEKKSTKLTFVNQIVDNSKEALNHVFK